jgi:hypothetical protein
VAALDWATWHLYNQPKHDTCQPPIGPRSRAVLPHQLSTSITVLPSQLATSIAVLPSRLATSADDVTRAMCHPYSGDTCHLEIGPTVRPNVQICLPHVITQGFHITCTDLPRQCTDMPCQHPYGLYGLHSQQFFFAYLTFRIERDIFSIRSPFDKVNIPLESGRQGRRNGVGFVGF